MDERTRVEELSSWYSSVQLPIDKKLVEFRYESIKGFFFGDEALELGPAEGIMTRLLARDFRSLTVVEGSKSLLDEIPNFPGLEKVHSLFEDFEPEKAFSTIIMDHVLEHVENPSQILRKAKQWLSPGGRILVGVPNARSLHRLAAVKMGILASPDELNARDLSVGHRRVYSLTTLSRELESAGLRVDHVGGVFLKPVSFDQIQSTWSAEMISGFLELGKDFPDLAAEIFAVALPEAQLNSTRE